MSWSSSSGSRSWGSVDTADTSSDGAQRGCRGRRAEEGLHLGMGGGIAKLPEAIPLMRVFVCNHAMLTQPSDASRECRIGSALRRRGELRRRWQRSVLLRRQDPGCRHPQHREIGQAVKGISDDTCALDPAAGRRRKLRGSTGLLSKSSGKADTWIIELGPGVSIMASSPAPRRGRASVTFRLSRLKSCPQGQLNYP
jgi:hypothetical protein